jgi:hypothetical protein
LLLQFCRSARISSLPGRGLRKGRPRRALRSRPAIIPILAGIAFVTLGYAGDELDEAVKLRTEGIGRFVFEKKGLKWH